MFIIIMPISHKTECVLNYKNMEGNTEQNKFMDFVIYGSRGNCIYSTLYYNLSWGLVICFEMQPGHQNARHWYIMDMITWFGTGNSSKRL